MTAICFHAKTRLLRRLELGLNNASLKELVLLQKCFMADGMSFIQMLTAQWKLAERTVSGSADQKHLGHVFGGDDPWWGPSTDAIATEGLTQTLQRMMYDPNGEPRASAKRVDMWWSCGAAEHFHIITTESAHQITTTWLTPPKPDQKAAFAAYKTRVASAVKAAKPKKAERLEVPSNFTRPEDSWVTAGSEWVVLKGVNEKGKAQAASLLVPTLSKVAKKRVTVVRSLCEAYTDRYVQVGKK